MTNSAIKELLTGIIDYAGLFPPAELSLHETLNNFVNYKNSEHSWMLGKIIIPENLLAQANSYLATKINKPLPVSILSQKPLEFFNSDSYSRSHALLDISCIETKLPTNDQALDFIELTCNQLQSKKIPIYFELPYHENWEILLPEVIAVIKKRCSAFVGFKLRCGAVTPDETPPISKLVQAIKYSSQAKVPIKFTAGLHHPIRALHADFGGYMHGFLNVYITTLLAYKYALSDEQLSKLLSDEKINTYMQNDKNFIYGDFNLDDSEIKTLRNSLVLSFGSCSFEEPLNDLREIKLL